MMIAYIQNENPAGDSLAPLGKKLFKKLKMTANSYIEINENNQCYVLCYIMLHIMYMCEAHRALYVRYIRTHHYYYYYCDIYNDANCTNSRFQSNSYHRD